jgi:hypothetical protein
VHESFSAGTFGPFKQGCAARLTHGHFDRNERHVISRTEQIPPKGEQDSGQKPVGFTAKRLQDSAQGGGFAEPWVFNINTRTALKERRRLAGIVCEAWAGFYDHLFGPILSLLQSYALLLSVPRVPQSLHPGLSPVTASR